MKLIDMVNFLFSKNAGPYLITFDVLFKDDVLYERARHSGVFNPDTLARLFKVDKSRIYSIHEYQPGRAIKFSMTREISSGDFGDRSVFGAQHWSPLIDLDIP